MRKLLKFINIIFLLLLPILTVAQDCGNFLTYYVPVRPFKYDSQSKSAACEAGKEYKFIVSLQKGKEYRISFYASPSFNNQMNFKILDENTGEIIVDLPGQGEEGEKSVLKPYFNGEKEEYPYFYFVPENSTKLKITIDILHKEGKEKKVGCVGMYMQNKVLPTNGFEGE